jgi:hypothetical protein
MSDIYDGNGAQLADILPTVKRRGRPPKQDHRIIHIPPQFATVADAVRMAMAWEKSGLTKAQACRKVNIGMESYTHARDIVMLMDRGGLSRRDDRLVRHLFREMNEKRRVRHLTERLRPLTEKVWGKRGWRRKDGKTRRDTFLSSISFLNSTCESMADVQIPYLNEQEKSGILIDLKSAGQALRALERRIKGDCT